MRPAANHSVMEVIVAATLSGGSIPWYLQEDLRRFRDTTMGVRCKIWDSLLRRDNFVISRTMPDATKATGGGEVLAHEECTKIYLTRVLWDGECDTLLEIPDEFKFTKITKLRVGAGGLRYWFEDYERQA